MADDAVPLHAPGIQGYLDRYVDPGVWPSQFFVRRSRLIISSEKILAICKDKNINAVIPGYGMS
jgi:hypothetical protein